MSTRQEQSKQEELRREEEASLARQQARQSQSLEALVRESVMAGLGEPADLHHVQVRQLWEGHYRVNVFVGADAVSSKVVHSYFLEADSHGKVLDSMPAIARLY